VLRAPQNSRAYNTPAPLGSAKFAVEELNVVGSASTSTLTIVKSLLLSFPVPLRPATHDDALVAPAAVLHVSSVFPTKRIAPAAFTLYFEVNGATIAAWACGAAATRNAASTARTAVSAIAARAD